MNCRILAFVLLSSIPVGAAITVQAIRGQEAPPQNHVAWVAQTLQQMETIKTGMTRTELLKVFTTEGGVSTPLRRTFVSRECPFFKVDVEFQAVGRPSRDANGRVTMVEDRQDIIVKISKPYLQFSITD